MRRKTNLPWRDGLNSSEEQLHKALIQWVLLNENRLPGLKLLFHIANGGYRNIITAARLKKLGVKRGVPDLFLACPKRGYAGFFIELKSPTGQVSWDQQWWIMELASQGYRVEVHRDLETVIKVLDWYMDGV